MDDANPNPAAPSATPETKAPSAAAPTEQDSAGDQAAVEAMQLAAFKAVKSSLGDEHAARRLLSKSAPGPQTSPSPTPASAIATDGDAQPSGGKEAPEGEEQEEGESDENKPGVTPTAGKKAKEQAPPSPAEQAVAALKPAQRIEYIHAEQALKRDGYSESEISDLIAGIGIDKTIKQGLKRRDAQKQQDLAWSKRRGSASPATNNAAGSSEARNPADSSRARADAAHPDATGDDPESAPGNSTADPLDEAIEGLTPAQQQAANARIAAANKRAEAAEAARDRDLVVNTIDRLTADFPALKAVDGQRQVLAQMNELDPTRAAMKDRAQLEALMRKAAWAVFGPSIQTHARQDRRAAAESALDGQMIVPRSTGAKKQVASDDEYAEMAYKAVKVSQGDESMARRLLAKA